MADLLVELERAHGRKSLKLFFKWSWHIVSPGRDLIWGRHIDVICEALERVESRECKRLIINIPPRTTKSTLVSVVFPAWCQIRNQAAQFLSFSHGAPLATRDAVTTRRLLSSEWAQERWPEVKMQYDQNAKTRYQLEGGGHRISFGMGSGATGEGADIILIDDPHPAKEGMWSEANRYTVKNTFDQEISTRVNDPHNSAIVLIMQRLHQDDLSGHLLAQGGWEHLCLPMEYDERISSPHDWRTETGQLLQPERFGEEWVRINRRNLGSYGYAGQMQQCPVPMGGGIFKTHWWKFYKELPESFDIVIQSWDATFKETNDGSFVVGQLWGKVGADFYLLDQTRRRMDFTSTLDAIRGMTQSAQANGHSLYSIVVEDKANGPAIINTLQREISGILPISVGGSKEARASSIAPMVEAGNVFLPSPDIASWVQADLLPELSFFPNAANDDQVDAMSQAINYLKDVGGSLISYG